MKCPEELWNVNQTVEEVSGGLDFHGRMEWRMTQEIVEEDSTGSQGS
jgi:hypothetical protein